MPKKKGYSRKKPLFVKGKEVDALYKKIEREVRTPGNKNKPPITD